MGPQPALNLSSPISSSLPDPSWPKRQPAGSHEDEVCSQLVDSMILAHICPPCKSPCEAAHPRGPIAVGTSPLELKLPEVLYLLPQA